MRHLHLTFNVSNCTQTIAYNYHIQRYQTFDYNYTSHRYQTIDYNYHSQRFQTF